MGPTRSNEYNAEQFPFVNGFSHWTSLYFIYLQSDEEDIIRISEDLWPTAWPGQYTQRSIERTGVEHGGTVGGVDDRRLMHHALHAFMIAAMMSFRILATKEKKRKTM